MSWQIDVEMYALGWVDISADGREPSATSGGGVSISRGRPDEGPRADPSHVSLVLDNTDGAYSPRNPLGEYYGLIGRNTPLRVGLPLASDDFDRTVPSGWGTADTGQEWSDGAGDYEVAAGVAEHIHSTANVLRYTVLADMALVDVEQVTDIRVPAAITGAAAVTGHLARWQMSGDCYWLRLEFNADGSSTQLKISKWVGGNLIELASLDQPPGLTYAAGEYLRLRTSVCGPVLAVKAWDPDDPEPVDWMLTAADTELQAAGAPGLLSWLVSGNTNTTPFSIEHAAYRAIDRRAVVEVAEWPARWDPSGGDVWAAITAAGPLRRLGQGRRPLRSALRRYIPSTSPRAWWPMEDGANSSQVASGLPGGDPLRVAAGEVEFVTDAPAGASGSLKIDADRNPLLGTISGVTASGWQAAIWVKQVQQTAATLSQFLPMLIESPSLAVGLVLQRSSSDVDTGGVLLYPWTAPDSGTITTALGSTPNAWDGRWHLLQVLLDQDGADIDVRVLFDGTEIASETRSAWTLTAPTRARMQSAFASQNTVINLSDWGVSHAVVHDGGTTAVDLVDAGLAWTGETAAARGARLCEEEGVPVVVVGDPDLSQPMGPQLPATLLDLLNACVTADAGMLTEHRAGRELVIHTRASLYNQTALALDYSARHLAPPLEPVDDDQAIRNVIVATGADTEYVAEQTTGPLSTSAPEDGGVGVYESRLDVNVAAAWQLRAAATWALALGTVDEARYPRVTMNLTHPVYTGDPDLTARVAAIDSGVVVSIEGLPNWLPPGPTEQLTLGYTETLDTHRRVLAVNAVPASPYRVGVVGETTRVSPTLSLTTAAFVAGTDTSMTVERDNTAHRLWITTADRSQDFPFDIMAAGVRLTVTGIAGSSDPQTMTVTATPVNGVVKTVPAGSVVTLAEPWRLAR